MMKILRLPLLGMRSIHLSPITCLKEISATKEGNVTVIQGSYVESTRKSFVVKTEDSTACPVCRLGLDIKHTDVLILHQFLRSDGCMLPKRITGLCGKQQKRISDMVAMAQKAGILTPPWSKSDPSKRKDYKKYNTYFDESTIKTYGW